MLRSSHILQLVALALLGLALVMVHSAGMTVQSQLDPRAMLLSRHTIYAGMALVAMAVASQINVRHMLEVRWYANPVLALFLLAVVLTAMTLIPGIGRSINGSSRWLYLGPRGMGISFQPSELVKWLVLPMIAWYCTARQQAMGSITRGMLPAMTILAAVCGLIAIEDLGTGVLIGVVGSLVLLAGGVRLWQMLLLIPPAAVGFYVAVMANPYRLTRLTAYLDPWADPRGSGYHPIQAMLAIAEGSVTGRGLGNGIQKFGYLPEDTTDFLFAVICEELGLVGAVAVVVAFLLLLWVGMSIVRRCPDTFGRLLALGIVLTISFQALINLAVVTVLMPTKGIALPLLSAGGTGWILTAAALGILASLEPDDPPATERDVSEEVVV